MKERVTENGWVELNDNLPQIFFFQLFFFIAIYPINMFFFFAIWFLSVHISLLCLSTISSVWSQGLLGIAEVHITDVNLLWFVYRSHDLN